MIKMPWMKSRAVAVVQDDQVFDSVFATSGMTGGSKTRAKVIAQALQRTFQIAPPNVKGVGFAQDDFDDGENSLRKPLSWRGCAIPDAQILYYAAQGFIGYQLNAMIAQNWLVDKACSMPGRHAIRVGFDITVTDGTEVKPAVLDKMRKMDVRLNLKNHLREAVKFCNIFGIRIVMFSVESIDPNYYENPFNLDGITPGSYKGIVQIDPQWCAPEFTDLSLTDPTSADYYEPTYWLVNGKRIHKSHLVILRTNMVADILKPTYLFGGISVPQRIASRVYAAERTADEAPQLALAKRLFVFKTNMAQGAANESDLRSKLAEWIEMMNNFGVKAIGMDETIEQHDTALNDLDETIMTQFQLVAASADVPATLLLNTAPKGFNSTGEHDAENWRIRLETVQEDVNPIIERHHALCIRSEISPAKPFETGVQWNPLDAPTEEKQSEINLKKAQTDEALCNTGAIDGTVVKDRLINDPSSGYHGLGDDENLDDENDDGTGKVGTPVNKTLQQISLNGPQMAELNAILIQVRDKEIAPDAAKAMLSLAFPLDDDTIDTLVNPMISWKKPEPETPPGNLTPLPVKPGTIGGQPPAVDPVNQPAQPTNGK